MSNPVKRHYQQYPYPSYPLLASVRRCDTYAINLEALWMRFNRSEPPTAARKILIAGCGTFSPYPFSVANPKIEITALDLSKRSLKRARLHCLLHGYRNITFRCGDLQDAAAIVGNYGLIDSYGVLHHLDDPAAGLKVLAERLMPGGIIRIMLYSRYARREEESIRHALRLLKINTAHDARKLLKGARPGSRLAQYLNAADETATNAGLADALLHPRVHTYKVDELLEMIATAGLKPLLFAHPGAMESVPEEIDRLHQLEKERRSPGNFVVYLGTEGTKTSEKGRDSRIVLNPCLRSAVNRFSRETVRIPPRIGHSNTPLGRSEKHFLRQFIKPVSCEELAENLKEIAKGYKRQLFLLEYDS